MAKIFKTVSIMDNRASQGTGETFTPVEMEAAIAHYWGDTSQEEVFPISVQKLKKMLEAAASGAVALRVSNIENRAAMTAEWTVFDEAQANAAPAEVVYFVLQDDYFYGPIELHVTPPRTMYGMETVLNIDLSKKPIVLARIAKSEDRSPYVCMHGAHCELLDGSGARNGGGAGGFRIPAP